MDSLRLTTVALLSLLSGQSRAELRLPTLNEAVQVSTETGRPILAMAGRKT